MASPKFALLARSFSTSNITQKLVKPPIQLFGIDGRYATALYSAATKQKTLDAVEKDLLSFQASIKSDERLRDFLANPTIKRSLKSEALKSVAQKANLSPQTGNLLQTLADNGRLTKLNAIINAFKIIMSAHRGEVICQITTARELDATQKKQLETVLKTFLKGKQSIHMTTKVDPSIVGGMVVSIGDRFVDMSVANKIKKYTDLISIAV